MVDTPSAAPLVVHVDVTDTVRAAWRAGIQRVVVQLVEHLRGRDDLDVVPVVWLDTAGGFRRLTDDEQRSITPGATVGAVPSPRAAGTDRRVAAGADPHDSTVAPPDPPEPPMAAGPLAVRARR